MIVFFDVWRSIMYNKKKTCSLCHIKMDSIQGSGGGEDAFDPA